MFEGLKIINRTLKLASKKRNISYVMDKELDKKLSDWFGKIFFEDVLYRVLDLEFLNVNSKKTIYLERIITKDGLSFYWDFEPKVNSGDRIDFEIGPGLSADELVEKTVRKIILSGNSGLDSYRKEYICKGDLLDRGFDGFELEKQEDRVIRIVDGIKYIRIQEEFDLTIKLVNGNDEMILTCPRLISEVVHNEGELIQYLVNVMKKRTINLDEVYNKVCELSLDKSSSVELNLYRNGKNISNFKFNQFTSYMTNNKKRKFEIFCNKNTINYNHYVPKIIDDDSYGILLIEVNSGNYRFILDVRLSNNREVILDNEIALREYLINLEFPVKIEEVYKKISEMSLGDINRYELIEVKVAYKNAATDLISIEKGNLNVFYFTRDDKEITILNDGYFTYKREDKLSKMHLELDDNMVTKCEYSSDKPFNMDIDGIVENPLQKGIIDAKNERTKTRILVDKYIKNERSEW